MGTKVLCPSLPDLLRKTVLTFCEGSVKFERTLEVIGSLHIRSDNEKVVTFMVDEQVCRPGVYNLLQQQSNLQSDGENQTTVFNFSNTDNENGIVENFDQSEDGNRSSSTSQGVELAPPLKKSRKLLKPVKKSMHLSLPPESTMSSDPDSDTDCIMLDNRDQSSIVNLEFEENNAEEAGKAHIVDHNDNIDSISNASVSSEENYEHYEQARRPRITVPPNKSAEFRQPVVLEVSSTRPDDGLQEISPPVMSHSSERVISSTIPSPLELNNNGGPQITRTDSYSESNSIPVSALSTYLPNISSTRDTMPFPQRNIPLEQLTSAITSMMGQQHDHSPIKVKEEYPVVQSMSNLNHNLTSIMPSSNMSITNTFASSLTVPQETFLPMIYRLPGTELLQYAATQVPQLFPAHSNTFSLSTPNTHAPILSPQAAATITAAGSAERDSTSTEVPAVASTSVMPESSENVTESSDKQLECPECGKNVKSYRMLESHMNTAHTHRTVYPCKQCGKVFYAPSSLHSHKKREHTPVDQKLKCPHCTKSYAFRSELLNHINMAHVDPRVNNTEQAEASIGRQSSDLRFCCPECGLYLKSKLCLSLHMNAKHTQKQAYPCKFCGKVFYAPSSRFCHVRRVHASTEQKFKCSVCGKVFSFHYELRNHMKMLHRMKMVQHGIIKSAVPAQQSRTPGHSSNPE